MLQRLSRTSPIESEVERGFDLREILNFAWRQWKFILAVVGIVLIMGTVYLLRQTPLYTATAQVLLDPRKEKAPGTEAILTDLTLDLAMVESQMAIIRSSVFLRRVVEKERLVADPEFGAAPSPGASAASSGSIPADVVASTEALRGAVSVGRAGQGYVLAISVTSMDPGRAARLANAVADAFIVDKLDTRFEAAKRASAWLSDRLTELRNQLRASEEAVAKFREQHGLVQSGNVTLNQQQLSELNAKVVGARAETAEKKARVDLLRSIEAKGGTAQSLPDIANLGSLPTLRQQEANLSQQEAELLSRYGSTHPLVVNVRAQHRDIERALAAEIQRIASNVKNDYELAKARVAAIEQSLKEATGQSSLDDTTAISLRELERNAAVNKSLFEDFLQRAKITEEQSKFEVREARVITAALPPGAPSYPRKSQYIAVTLFLGLLIGVGGAVAKEMLNAGFTTAKQVEDLLEVPLLSSISRMEERDLTVDGNVIPLAVYPAVKPLSRYSEAMRALRTGIQMTDVDNPPKVIQVTSAIPGEGKTTIALSFAASAANSGLKVLFIDGDLRHPSASRFLGLEQEPGLVDMLLGKADPIKMIRFHKDTRFWSLSAGSKTQNPPDLLGSERMKSLMDGFRASFDLIVIDTAPAGPVIDPIVVSQLADKIVFVVRWASTAREMVKHCMQQLSGYKKVAGVAFNLVNDRQAQKYGKYAYSYYYGSRYYKTYYSD